MNKEVTWDDIDEVLASAMRGKRPPSTFVGNGCSGGPDEIGGVDCAPACFFHDFAYLYGGTEKERKRADHELFYNLRTCGVPYFYAQKYYRAVRFWGVDKFQYRPHDCKPGKWKRFVLFFSRWVSF